MLLLNTLRDYILQVWTRTCLPHFHGLSVECRENWMVEDVWDGDFSSGDLHRAENFFGSGIRVESEPVC